MQILCVVLICFQGAQLFQQAAVIAVIRFKMGFQLFAMT